MKVFEVIKELQKCDKDSEVVFADLEPVRGVYSLECGGKAYAGITDKCMWLPETPDKDELMHEQQDRDAEMAESMAEYYEDNLEDIPF